MAAAAAALCAAAGRALGADAADLANGVGLAAAGTFVVYNVDRLRDVEQDRATTPRRTALVERHRRPLVLLTGLAVVAAGVLAWRAGPETLVLALGVLSLGLAHRRLKSAWWKPLYVTAAWVAVVVGIPLLALPQPGPVGWVAALVAAAVFANAVASNLRDDEEPSAVFGARVPLRLARGAAALGVALALLGPGGVRPLGLVPLATLAALAAFHPSELYGLVVVDGALLAGALGALVLL